MSAVDSSLAGATIVRLTDSQTISGTRIANLQEWFTGSGGWADLRSMNADSTLLAVSNAGGGAAILRLDPATLEPTTLGLARGFGFPQFSKTSPMLAFSLDPSVRARIDRIEFSAWQPRVTSQLDFSQMPGCAQAFADGKGWREMSAAWDDHTFALAIAPDRGQQDSATDVFWSDGTTCKHFVEPAGDTLHAIRISGDGQTVMIGDAHGTPGRKFWRVESGQVDAAHSLINNGHFAMGYRAILTNAAHTADGKWCKVGPVVWPLATLAPNYVLATRAQCGLTLVPGDDHLSWNDDTPSDDAPMATTTITKPPGTPVTAAWQNEILLILPGGLVHRVAHTYNTGKSQFFTCNQAIGSISQDGRLFFFSSDWGGTLGADSAGRSRCDVFVTKLR
jgi:hypothetical protein